jgi:SAM-dependent methyltransferase
MWRGLRAIRPLRVGVHLAIHTCQFLRDPYRDAAVWERMYALEPRAWNYASNPEEQAYFKELLALLDIAGGRFGNALEIGTGDGNFTEVLAPRCRQLLSVDISANALARARERRTWEDHVSFRQWNVRTDPLDGTYDLIVTACVLESIHRPAILAEIRGKLVGALENGGYLLVATTRSHPVVETGWLGRRFVRGSLINAYLAAHPVMETLATRLTDGYAFSLLRKAQAPGGRAESRPQRQTGA